MTTSYNIYQQITSVRLATTVNLTGRYFNGSLNNGVGATLTASSVGALVVDGIEAQIGDRIFLIKQTNTNENGIYVVNLPGSSSSLWQIQRASDFQSLEQIKIGQYFTVGAGNTLDGDINVIVEPLPSVIGLENFTFANIPSSGGGGGVVTEIDTGAGLTGGPITSTGTISLAPIDDKSFLANTSGSPDVPIPTPLSTVLLSANNLSDVPDIQTSLENLGFGEGGVILLLDSDFIAGVYTLTNPCSARIEVACSNAGNILKLPPAQGPDAFSINQGIVLRNDPGFQPIIIHLSDNSLFFTLPSPFGGTIKLVDNSTPEGSWDLVPYVFTANGLSGDITIGDSSPVSLNDAYNNPPNANIFLNPNLPISIQNVTQSSDVNSITTASTGSNTVANNRVLGWTFTVSGDITVTALQYDDSLFTQSGTRETGIYLKSTMQLLGSVFIAKTDTLVSGYRTHNLSIPINLTAGIEYVFATVMAANETNHLNSDAVPAAAVSVTEYWVGPASGLPLPLTFPQSSTATANVVQVGSFVYDSTTINEEFNINDSSTDPAALYKAESTTRGGYPWPEMKVAQRDAISSPPDGLTVFVSDTTPKRPYVFDGVWEGLSYVSDTPILTQGQLIMGVNSASPVAGNLTSSDNSIAIDVSTNGIIDLLSTAASQESLQDAYDIGNTIAISTSRPIQFSQVSLGAVTNGVTTPSTGINATSNYDIRGFTFVPSSDMYITAFQVEDSTLGVGQTRTLGIYRKTDSAELLVGNVSKTDTLVGIWRTRTVSAPVLLQSGVQYILSALVPPAQTYRNSTTAVAGADLSITEFSTGASSAFPIPLSCPTFFNATANETPYGAFRYQTANNLSEVDFTVDDSSIFMEAKSTVRATIPAPVMSDSQFSSISGKLGMMGYSNTSNRILVFVGMGSQKVAWLTDFLSGTFTPGISNVTNTSSLTFIKGFYTTCGTSSGNVITCTLQFSCSVSAGGLCTVQLASLPVSPGNFADTLQASLMGGAVYTNGSPAIGDGSVIDLISNTGATTLNLSFLVANTSGPTKIITASFTYVVQ